MDGLTQDLTPIAEAGLAWRPGYAKRCRDFEASLERAAEPLPECKGRAHLAWLVERVGFAVGLERGERELLLALVGYLRRGTLSSGRAMVAPRNSWLAEGLDRSVRHVQATLAALERAGWLLRRYSERNRRYDGAVAGIDLGPLIARQAELEAALQAMLDRRRRRPAEAPETARAGAASSGMESSQDASACIPYKERQPKSNFSEKGSFARREDVGPAPGIPGAAGGAAASSPYFEPGKAAHPPATREGIVALLREIDPDLGACMTRGCDGWADLASLAWSLARVTGIPRPVYDKSLGELGLAHAAAAIVLARARTRAGLVKAPVAYMRSLLEAKKPVDLWRSLYAIKRRAMN